MNTSPELVDKLENLIDRVSQKKVFVVNKTSDTDYEILDYASREPVIRYLPTRDVAEKICNKYNHQKFYTLTRRHEIAHLLRKISSYRAELEYYNNVASNAESDFARTTAQIRKTESRARINNYISELMAIV